MNIEIAALDALIDNPESIKQINESIEYFGFHLDNRGIEELIASLLEKKYIKIYYAEDGSRCCEDIWFEITASGKRVWEMYTRTQENIGDKEDNA